MKTDWHCVVHPPKHVPFTCPLLTILLKGLSCLTCFFNCRTMSAIVLHEVIIILLCNTPLVIWHLHVYLYGAQWCKRAEFVYCQITKEVLQCMAHVLFCDLAIHTAGIQNQSFIGLQLCVSVMIQHFSMLAITKFV